MQPSGSYLKIERTIKNLKIGRAKKVRKKENHKIWEKKGKNKKIGGIKKSVGGKPQDSKKIKRKNLKVEIKGKT